jgi:hypothetical protein
MTKHLVVAVGGASIAALYGTPGAHPDQFLDEIANTLEASDADSIEFICVDPNTNARYTNDLHPHEKGFKKPTYNGEGWNAKVYKENPHGEGVSVASDHLFCGSYSTNGNNAVWIRDVPGDVVDKAIDRLETKLGLTFQKHTYHKHDKSGTVPTDLVGKTKTPYAHLLNK